MPTIFRHGGYRFFFFSNEGDPREPPHVHVRRGEREAKFWVRPEVVVDESFGFNAGVTVTVHEMPGSTRRAPSPRRRQAPSAFLRCAPVPSR